MQKATMLRHPIELRTSKGVFQKHDRTYLHG